MCCPVAHRVSCQRLAACSHHVHDQNTKITLRALHLFIFSLFSLSLVFYVNFEMSYFIGCMVSLWGEQRTSMCCVDLQNLWFIQMSGLLLLKGLHVKHDHRGSNQVSKQLLEVKLCQTMSWFSEKSQERQIYCIVGRPAGWALCLQGLWAGRIGNVGSASGGMGPGLGTHAWVTDDLPPDSACWPDLHKTPWSKTPRSELRCHAS